MKNKHTDIRSFEEKHSQNSAWHSQMITYLLKSNWKLAALLAALSAWTGGILYV